MFRLLLIILSFGSYLMAHDVALVRCSFGQVDIQLTKHLKQALALIDMALLDNFIVSGVSLAERGLV